MGLDTTHDCWSGPYSAFHRWRALIAKAAGFPPLDIMDGFYDAKRTPPTTGDYHADLLALQYHSAGRLPLKWESQEGDKRLLPLLTHSDCDGDIPADLCGSIADALEALLPGIEIFERWGRVERARPGYPARADYDGTVAATRRFIDGLRRAAAAGEAVEFH